MTESFENIALAFEGKSNQALRKMKRLFGWMKIPFLTSIPAKVVQEMVRSIGPVRRVVKGTMFEHFCGGETIEECESLLEAFQKKGIQCVLDYAMENAKEMRSYEANRDEVIRMIDDDLGAEKGISFAVLKLSSLGEVSLMEKHQEGKNFKPFGKGLS